MLLGEFLVHSAKKRLVESQQQSEVVTGSDKCFHALTKECRMKLLSSDIINQYGHTAAGLFGT